MSTAATAATARWAMFSPHGGPVPILMPRRPLRHGAPAPRPATQAEARAWDDIMARRDFRLAPGAAWETDDEGYGWALVELSEGHWASYRADEFAPREDRRRTAVSYAPWGAGDIGIWRGLAVRVVNTLGGSTAVVELVSAAPEGYRWPPEMEVPFWALGPAPHLGARETADRAGVQVNTLRAYVARGHAPQPTRRNPRTGAQEWAEAVIDAWLASRPGAGARTDLAGRWA